MSSLRVEEIKKKENQERQTKQSKEINDVFVLDAPAKKTSFFLFRDNNTREVRKVKYQTTAQLDDHTD